MPSDLTVLIAPAGAGKTTFVKRTYSKKIVVVSLDKIRAQLYGDAAIQGDRAEVLKVQRRKLRQHLRGERSIVVDNTSVTLEARTELLRIGRLHKARVSAILFDVTLAQCIEGNLQRERRVPEDVIFTQYGRYMETLGSIATEGFDAISIIKR